jgi:hypothetical protein
VSKDVAAAAPARRIEVTGELDRRTAEALALEIRRLARQHGVEVVSCNVLPATDDVEGEDSAVPGQEGLETPPAESPG